MMHSGSRSMRLCSFAQKQRSMPKGTGDWQRENMAGDLMGCSSALSALRAPWAILPVPGLSSPSQNLTGVADSCPVRFTCPSGDSRLGQGHPKPPRTKLPLLWEEPAVPSLLEFSGQP
jgi:hypothetical protein